MNQHARVERHPIPFIDVAAQRRRLGKAIDDAIARVLESLPVPYRARGAGLRGRAREILRRAVTPCQLLQRHRRLVMASDGEGYRPRRCGVLSDLHLLRDRGSGGAGRRDPGFRRCRCRDLQHRCARASNRAIATAKRLGLKPKAVIPVDLFGLPADHDADRRSRQGAKPVHAGRCRAGLRRAPTRAASSAPSATPPRPAFSRPSRSAATAMAARY